MHEPLPEGVVQVWYARPCADWARLWPVLSDVEHRRAERFRHDDVRNLYVTAHALVRHVLSQYAPIDPRAWNFTIEGQGKPRVELPEFGWLQFNLSHTSGMAICAVTRGHPVGVDVEHLLRRERRGLSPEENDCLPLARYCLADREYAQLEGLEFLPRWDRFLRFWTLKEAYLKACGSGISQPLHEFAFSWAPPRIEFLSGQDEGSQWYFEEHRPSDEHVAAVGLRCPAIREVLWREFTL